MAEVVVYGAGQLGKAVALLLSIVPAHNVGTPFGRDDRVRALASGADVVIIATTSLFKDVAEDIEMAVSNGSNVLVSSEESAFPFVVDESCAVKLDKLAKSKGVSIAGCGVNPGLIFDSLVLTLLGAAPKNCTIEVRRIVNIAGFGTTVLRRLGIGATPDEFENGVANGEILGHAGFLQSMNVVAQAMRIKIEKIEKLISPISTNREIKILNKITVKPGECAGVNQTYTAYIKGEPWFVSHFYGHIDLPGINMSAVDKIQLFCEGELFQTIELKPGISSQIGSQNMVANSIQRIINAPSGWVTVADMQPAYPEF